MISRPQQHLIDLVHCYPSIWQQVDRLHQQRGHTLPNWPAWCFLPLTAAATIVSAHRGGRPLLLAEVTDLAIISALAAWRTTQGIYRFDPDVFRAVWETPVAGELPIAIFFRLPERCVYIETSPHHSVPGLIGVFAHLEHDLTTQRAELRLLLDTDTGLLPLLLHLQPGSLADSLRAVLTEAQRQANRIGMHYQPAPHRPRLVEPLAALLLYLCSTAADIAAVGGSDWPPTHPHLEPTGQEVGLPPPDEPTLWNVGFRLGAALHQAQLARPAGRRSRWYSCWTGPLNAPDRKLELYWLPPGTSLRDVEALLPMARKIQ